MQTKHVNALHKTSILVTHQSQKISPDVKKVTESSGDDERDCSEHRQLSDSETESVELETKIAKIPGPKSVGKKNTPSESPHSGKILNIKIGNHNSYFAHN